MGYWETLVALHVMSEFFFSGPQATVLVRIKVEGGIAAEEETPARDLGVGEGLREIAKILTYLYLRALILHPPPPPCPKFPRPSPSTFPITRSKCMQSARSTRSNLFVRRVKLDASSKTLTAEQKATLQANIQFLRDVIVCFTATGAARGVSGHTGMCQSDTMHEYI